MVLSDRKLLRKPISPLFSLAAWLRDMTSKPTAGLRLVQGYPVKRT
jgi:hypothetical protein